MDIGAADDVAPRIALELSGESDQFEAILGRQQRPRDPDGVQTRSQQDDREQTATIGHRDPP